MAVGSCCRPGEAVKVSTYEHDGSFDWKCLACRAEGTKAYTNLVTKTESPKICDFDEMVTAVEVEHALTGCNGHVEYAGGFRHRYVERRGAA